MTRTPHRPRWAGRSARLAALSAIALGATLAGPGTASAAFTIPECQGGNILGAGASFQNSAQALFKSKFEPFCNGPTVTYGGGGSGKGRRVMGERTAAPGDDNSTGTQSRTYAERYGGTDEPLSDDGKAQIENGTDNVGDEGKIHQVPVAAGAIVAAVNFPDNCDVKSLPPASQTAPAATDFTNRVQFSKDQWEQMWNGAMSGAEKASQWGDIFPTLKAIPQNLAGKTDQQCLDQQIIRVVRFDDSGTSFSFKDALHAYEPGRGWDTTFKTPDTRTWPNATATGPVCAADKPGPEGFIPAGLSQRNLKTGCANGNGPLLDALNSTDGSIGYADLATAVAKNLRITPTADPALRDDDKYWTRLPNGSNIPTEPTTFGDGFKTTSPAGTGGANCANVQYSNLPTSTLGRWTDVAGVDDDDSWGICTLTYVLAFDDYSDTHDSSDAEQAKARTVKDFLVRTLQGSTQQELPANNYSALSLELRALALTGVSSMDWLKDGGGGTTPPPGGGTTPPPSLPPGGGTPPPLIISNAFSLPRTVINRRRGTATFSVKVPGPGVIRIRATARVGRPGRKRTIRVGGVRATVTAAGTYKLTLKPGPRARGILNRTGRLRVRVKITFTPVGGTARSTIKTITLKKNIRR